MRTERHALYARATSRKGDATFRVGQPVDWDLAIDRHTRATNNLIRAPYIRHQRRKYRVKFYEVRSVDEHGRGLGREDHALAIPVHGNRQHRIR